MKIKFNSNDYLLLGKTLETYDVVIVSRFVFSDSNRYHPQKVLNECLYKLAE